MMNSKCLNAWNLVWLLLAVVATGCGGGGPGRYGVSGTVTFKGKNLDKGQITFSPAEQKGMQGGAEIVNGSYKIDAKQGLTAGKYKVSISSPEGGTSVAAGENPGDPAEVKLPTERIPEKYNAKTELTKDVTDGDNKFDFNLD